jgi:hypothetical protein
MTFQIQPGLHRMRGTFPDFAGEEAFAVVVGVFFFFWVANYFATDPQLLVNNVGFI